MPKCKQEFAVTTTHIKYPAVGREVGGHVVNAPEIHSRLDSSQQTAARAKAIGEGAVVRRIHDRQRGGRGSRVQIKMPAAIAAYVLEAAATTMIDIVAANRHNCER